MFSFFNLKKQIAELRQDNDRLRKEFQTLELEWTDMYDRMRRVLMKISKRQERAEDTQRVDGEDETATHLAGTATARSSLTPRQLAWQERILAHRNRTNQGGGE
jgi:chromosome segregation ATPase